VMNSLVPPEQLSQANRLRRLWSLYQQNQDLIQVGAYEHGSNPDLDEAIKLRDRMEELLQQGSQETISMNKSWQMLDTLLADAP
jgi:flagellum-specific ATP synthase